MTSVIVREAGFLRGQNYFQIKSKERVTEETIKVLFWMFVL